MTSSQSFSDMPEKQHTQNTYNERENPSQQARDFYAHEPYKSEEYEEQSMQIKQVGKQYEVSFSSLIEIPKQYELMVCDVSNFSYNLHQLSIVQETGKKTVTVDECGQAELDLYTLKMKGNISLISNVEIRPSFAHESKIGMKDFHLKTITLSVFDHIPVDTVLKYSLTPLAHHVVDTHHIHIKAISLVPVSAAEPTLFKICGVLQFLYE